MLYNPVLYLHSVAQIKTCIEGIHIFFKSGRGANSLQPLVITAQH